jgi:hypothetical protein
MSAGHKYNKTHFVIGLVLISIGIICNEWVLGVLFSADRVIQSTENKIIILIFEILCVIVGVLLIWFRKTIRAKEVLFSIITFFLFLLFLEGGIRFFYFVKNKITPRERNFSNYLGWETVADYHSRYIKKGYGKINYSTKKWGFRVLGDVHTNKVKIFVIGDSYTQGLTVSDGETYFDFIKDKANNVEIFAYGGGGYGSLQEYMILDKYFDIIRPDIILWQFASNDFINNEYELECASFRNNNHMVRPYYGRGQIEWRYPTQSRGLLYKIVQSSYLLRFLDIRIKILKDKKSGSIEDRLNEYHPLLKKTITTTTEIFGLVKKRIGNIPIFAFCVDNPKWLGTALLDICRNCDLHYIPGIPEAVLKQKELGIAVDGSPFDSHWNKNGHAIAGRIIVDYFIKNKII